MKSALEHLVQCCRGDDRPDCPIIDSLESADPVAQVRAGSATRKAGLRAGRR